MLGTNEYPLFLFKGEREGTIFEGGVGAMGPLVLEQLRAMKKLGSLENIVKMLPGGGDALKQMDIGKQEKEFQRMEGMVCAMAGAALDALLRPRESLASVFARSCRCGFCKSTWQPTSICFGDTG